MFRFLKRIQLGLFQPGRTLTQRTVRGTLWLVMGSGAEQIIVVLQTFILWRLLDAHDFGVFRIAMVAVFWSTLLTETGFNKALIQRDEVTHEVLDTALWVQIFRNVIQFAVLFLLADPVAAWLAAKPDMTPEEIASLQVTVRLVLQVIAVRFLFTAFKSPGVHMVIRAMNFKRDIVFERVYNLIAFAATIGVALVTRNYWAIIVGQLVLAVADLVGSYLIYPYLPTFRFRWRIVKELMQFGVHVYLLGLLHCVAGTLDEIMLMKLLRPGAFGIYATMKSLAAKPAGLLWMILARVTFPAYASLKKETARLNQAFVRIVGLAATVAMPVFAGLILVAPSLVTFLCTDKAKEGIPIFMIFGIFACLQLFNSLADPLFQGTGKPHLSWIRMAIAFVVYVPAMVFLVRTYEMQGGAWGQVVRAAVVVVLGVFLVCRVVRIRIGMLLLAISRPLAATAVMTVVLLPLFLWVADTSVLWLFVLPPIGALVYVGMTLVVNRPAIEQLRIIRDSLMGEHKSAGETDSHQAIAGAESGK